MINLGSWMNKVLTGWGVDEKIANTFDEAIIAILLVAVAIGLDYLCQAIFVGGVRSIVKHTHYKWDTLLIKRKVVHYLVHTIPGILVYVLLPMAFIRGKELLFISQKICAVYIIFSLLLALNGLLLMMLDLFNQQEKMKNRPMKGFIQVLQVLVFFVGGIVIIAILVNKSPATLFAGLGASAAILMLVFKDSILGFVAGIQLSANDMLRPGDWITMPSANANGIVQEITLNTVKVQNFDNTISTIPPYNLVNSSFQNWRGMHESGGRRIKRYINIDITTVHFCSEEELRSLASKGLYSTDKMDDSDGVVNLYVFRRYALGYICSRKDINQDFMRMVRVLQPTSEGLPVEIYCFTNNTEWLVYESIQGAIFDHLIAMLPAFGLRAFQRPSGADLQEHGFSGHALDE